MTTSPEARFDVTMDALSSDATWLLEACQCQSQNRHAEVSGKGSSSSSCSCSSSSTCSQTTYTALYSERGSLNDTPWILIIMMHSPPFACKTVATLRGLLLKCQLQHQNHHRRPLQCHSFLPKPFSFIILFIFLFGDERYRRWFHMFSLICFRMFNTRRPPLGRHSLGLLLRQRLLKPRSRH